MYVQASYDSMPKMDLAAVGLSHDLGYRKMNNSAPMGTLQTKAAGETLFSEGDEADAVYEVVRGTLRLYKMLPDGRRQIIGFVSAANMFGLSPEGVRAYTAEAVSDTALRRFPHAAFDRLIDEQPGFARRLLNVASDELGAAQEQMLLLGRMTAMEKVASFLLVLAKRQGRDNARSVDVPMGRNDIADYLGLTIETVSRTLSRLKRARLIGLPAPTRVEIRDRHRLEMLAVNGAAGVA
jgi:CRP/FNR family transcriptional regulator, anaerobic regulatory protein